MSNEISSEAGQWPLFPGYTIVSSNKFQVDYNITITLTLM